jgi:hypothetical protein
MNKGGTRHGHCRRTCRLRRVADKVDAGSAPLPRAHKNHLARFDMAELPDNAADIFSAPDRCRLRVGP